MTLLFTVFALSLGMTWCIKRYALHRNILDVPNHRSSHVNPTPRGGGLAFVCCFLLALPLLWYFDVLDFSLTLGLGISGFCIAVIGLLDDHKDIPARWRLLAHVLVGIIALVSLGGMPEIPFYKWTLQPGLLADLLGLLYLVWLLNLYNFMDGIDGLAGLEAIFVCLSAALLYVLNNQMLDAILPLTLAFAVAGFLYWNFPPARIFMGDVGSGFLGLILGMMSLHAASLDAQFFWSWLILLGVFVVDATVTLLRRAHSGQTLFEAHCSHGYQHASRFFKGHFPVVIFVLLVNIFWLLPWATLVGQGYVTGILGVLLAYIPLVVGTLIFRAGALPS